MVTYKITHTTKYKYSDAVPVCHNVVHLAPRELPYQSCQDFSLLLNPAPPYRQRRVDYFGNLVDYFSIHVAHQGLTVTAHSLVRLSDKPDVTASDSLPWEDVAQQVARDMSPNGLGVRQFVYASPYIHDEPAIGDYVRESFWSGRPIIEAASDLNSRIHRDFRYDPKATTLNTSVSEVFRDRAGVCQDFAHFEIACLRSLGLPARYVSGYLRTVPPPGKPRLVGADASHAWLALWCGPAGWLDLDPTNNVAPQTDHVTIAWGRDYGDVCPIQGVVIGGGHHVMSVAVDMVVC